MKVSLLISALAITSIFVIAFDLLSQEYFINLFMSTSRRTTQSPITSVTRSFDFPDGFLFGVASSAFQIEGAWDEDGKSPSMWDVFIHKQPDLVRDGSNADIGPNSYHFYEDDVKAIKSIGFHHYRFSVSWTRIMPNGSSVNQLGIKYYETLIDNLIANDIEPVVTIFHWDLPQFLQDLGGLTNPIFVKHFEAYADVLFKAFGRKVKRWITLNEPYTSCIMSYEIGKYAPGIKSPGVGNYLCVHHLLMGHAAVYRLYERKYRQKFDGEVGIALESIFFFKNGSITDDEQYRAMQYRFGWFANPIFGSGGYPHVMVEEIAANSKFEGRPFSRLPEMSNELKQSIHGAADFLGLNYYTSAYLNIDKTVKNSLDEPSWFSDCRCRQSKDPLWKKGKNAWMHSVPEGLRSLLKWIKREYKNPKVFISENGWSDDGEINDRDRIEYFKSHLKAVSESIKDDACNVVGYSVWSLLDSFEWDTGFSITYGILSVNYLSPRRERSEKESARFWRRFLERKMIDDWNE